MLGITKVATPIIPRAIRTSASAKVTFLFFEVATLTLTLSLILRARGILLKFID